MEPKHSFCTILSKHVRASAFSNSFGWRVGPLRPSFLMAKKHRSNISRRSSASVLVAESDNAFSREQVLPVITGHKVAVVTIFSAFTSS